MTVTQSVPRRCEFCGRELSPLAHRYCAECRPKRSPPAVPPSEFVPLVPRRCDVCGVEIPGYARRYCDGCGAARKRASDSARGAR